MVVDQVAGAQVVVVDQASGAHVVLDQVARVQVVVDQVAGAQVEVVDQAAGVHVVVDQVAGVQVLGRVTGAPECAVSSGRSSGGGSSGRS